MSVNTLDRSTNIPNSIKVQLSNLKIWNAIAIMKDILDEPHLKEIIKDKFRQDLIELKPLVESDDYTMQYPAHDHSLISRIIEGGIQQYTMNDIYYKSGMIYVSFIPTSRNLNGTVFSSALTRNAIFDLINTSLVKGESILINRLPLPNTTKELVEILKK